MQSTLSQFRRLAAVEATSFLLLLVAAVLKRTADQPLGVEILGPIHGALFVGYVVIALTLRTSEGWSRNETGLVLAGAVIPFGGFYVERRLKP